MECVDEIPCRSNCLRLCEGAWGGLDDVDPVSETVSFVTSKEEYFVLYDRASNGTPKLVHPQREFGRGTVRPDTVKEIARVELVIAQVLEKRPVKCVASGLRHDADLPSGSGAEFRCVHVGFD